jgi:predicted RNA-binding protein with PUA-like domain
MARWLVKSEPSSWSWDDQVKAGVKGTAWSGVRNHLAKKNLSMTKKGELCFFYHSNEGKEIVGICEVTKEAYPDPTAKKGEPWLAVDLKAKTALKKPVSLAEIKEKPKLASMTLVKTARLSVQPVTAEEWKFICSLGGV